MSEPQFIPSGRPHSVEISEGSSVAKSRSGAAGTEIRRTEQDRFANDQDLAVEAHNIVLQASATQVRGEVKVYRHDKIERANKASVPGSASAAHEDQNADANARTALHTTVYDQEMVEMDFPARLIQLKIDNDNVREQLQVLESLMRDE